MARILFSVAPDYFPAARRELQRAFAGAQIERLGDDVGVMTSADGTVAAVAEQCRQRPIVFIQRLASVDVLLPRSEEQPTAQDIVRAATTILAERHLSGVLALQPWRSSDVPASQGVLKDWVPEITAGLIAQGFTVTRAGQDHILSVCVTRHVVALGVDRREDILADWPGGQVHLALRPEQISRSELKLEELLRLGALTLPAAGTVLDLGAAPGGWTRIMRQHGLHVWAVDPAALDPRLAGDHDVHHIAQSAQRFLAETYQIFDLILNDMRMDGDRSASVLVDAAPRLRPGGLAVLTVKLSSRDPTQQVATVIAILERAYSIIFARQLFHNRHEMTIVARRKGQKEPTR